MRKITLFILTTLFFWTGCQNNSIPPNERLIGDFKFNNVYYLYYGDDGGSGNMPHYGKIKVTSNNITIILNNGEQEITEICEIRKVLYLPEESEYKYFTNKGYYYVKVSNNIINEVQNNTSIGLAKFSKK